MSSRKTHLRQGCEGLGSLQGAAFYALEKPQRRGARNSPPGALCVANDLFSGRNPEHYENAQITPPMSAMLTIQ